MTYEEVQPFLGNVCAVRVRCIACREMHDFVGHLRPGRLHGDVDVRGHSFSVEDVEAAWLRRPPARPRRRRFGLTLVHRLREALSSAV